MTKRIVYTRPDGGVSIVIPAPNWRDEGENDEAFLARVMARSVPQDATDVHVCDVSEIPGNRTFRDAWRRGALAAVEVDMPKARDIHMNRIRAVRDKELAKLDIEQMKGKDVAAEKQALRDIPQTFDLTVAESPDDLDALWPIGLAKV